MITKKNINFNLDIFLLSIFIIISFHFIIYDKIFFFNKISYISYYLTIFGLFFSLIVVGLEFLFKLNINIQKFFIFIIFLNIFFSFYHFIDIFYPSILLIEYEVLLRIFIVFIIFYLSFLLSIKTKFIKKSDIYNKFKIIKFLIVFVLIINSLIFIKDLIISKFTEKNDKKIVLIYFDGLPKSALGNYNKKIKKQIINDELKNDFSIVQYNNFITSFTGTCGYFSGFFNFDSKKSLITRNGEYKNFLNIDDFKTIKHSKSLFLKLQENNLSYKQLIGHACSTEMGNLSKSQSINFNSMLIFNSKISNILNFIGLKNNQAMNSSWYSNNDAKSFYHTNTPYVFYGLSKKLFAKLYNKKTYHFKNKTLQMLSNSNENLTLIHFANSYWKGSEENYARLKFNQLIDEINDFFLMIKKNSNHNNTLFIITSDHGYEFDASYSQSQSDEVIYVPFLIIEKKKENPSQKVVDILCDNIDLSKSILNYFINRKNFYLECNQEIYTSISQINEKEKKWLITLFDNNKQIFNLYDYYFKNNIFKLKHNTFLNSKKNLFENMLKKYSLKISN